MFPSAIITKKSAKVLQDKQSFYKKKREGAMGFHPFAISNAKIRQCRGEVRNNGK